MCVCIGKIHTDIFKNETTWEREKTVKKQQIDFLKELELMEMTILIIEIKNSIVS